jgi:hypothetical protein
MSTGVEISIIRSMVKSYKPSSSKQKSLVSNNKKDNNINKTDVFSNFEQKNDILKEISSYSIDGTIERIASENKNLVDILG